MITKEEYIKALEIVEAFHSQLNLSINRSLKTSILEWEKLDDCSIRLRNVLYNIRQGNDYNEENIEDIKIKKMRRLRNCGRKTLNEFINLRGY